MPDLQAPPDVPPPDVPGEDTWAVSEASCEVPSAPSPRAPAPALVDRGTLAPGVRQRLLADARRVMREELSELTDDWAERQQQQAQLQTRSLGQLFAHHGQQLRASLDDCQWARQYGEEAEPQPPRKQQQRHHTWAPHDLVVCSPAGSDSPQRSPLLRSPLMRSPLLRLPAAATRQPCSPRGREETPKGHCPSAGRPPHCGGDRPMTCPGTPTSMMPKMSRQNTGRTENESERRNEEDERWRHQWRHQMKARLTRRLGSMGSMRGSGSFTRGVTVLLGLSESACQQPQPQKPQVRSWPERALESDTFRLISGLEILFNLIYVGIQTNLSIRNAMAVPPIADPGWLEVVNDVSVGIFVGEVVLRLLVFRCRLFYGKGWRWSAFEVALAAYLVCDELLGDLNLTYARLLRSFRLVRVLRIIRILRFLGDLRMMVSLILQSLVSLGWAFLLLFLIIFLFTVCFIHGAATYMRDGGVPEVRDQIRMYYGSVGSTMFSLLMAISGGVNWSELVEPLAQISVVYQVLFSFYVLFVLIGVLNVLTSVFVQRAHQLSKQDRELVVHSAMVSNEAFLTQMKAVFDEVDVDGTGKVTWETFKEYLQHEHVQAYFATHQLDTSDARELFNLLDVDGTGEVKVEDFVMGCLRLRGQAKSSDVASLLREHKRANQKHSRLLRKIDSQLQALLAALQGDCSRASWMQSPRSASSCC